MIITVLLRLISHKTVEECNILDTNIWEVCYAKFDFLICLSDRSQCLEYHGIIDFAYKLQLYY